MGPQSGEIKSGALGDPAKVYDYRAEQLGGILIERVLWREPAPELHNGAVITGPGYAWYRFWLPRFDQVVERYYTAAGALVGTSIDLCMGLAWGESGWRARDLIMDLWIDPQGAVTLHREQEYEQAVAGEALSDEEARYAEDHLRKLTTAIAQDRFPPPLVRNWQIDLRRLHGAGETSGEQANKAA